jgi:integrase
VTSVFSKLKAVDLLSPHNAGYRSVLAWLSGLVPHGGRVTRAGFHDLRRLNATTLVVGGVDVKTVQVRLGHADPRRTLAIYASAPAIADRAVAGVLGQQFFGQYREG